MKSNEGSPLIFAIQKNAQNVVQALLDGGISVRGADQYGRSVLEVGVLSCNVGIIRLLVERGMDIEARNRGMTLLLLAVSSGLTESAKALLDLGADVKALNRNRDNWEVLRDETVKKKEAPKKRKLADNDERLDEAPSGKKKMKSPNLNDPDHGSISQEDNSKGIGAK